MVERRGNGVGQWVYPREIEGIKVSEFERTINTVPAIALYS